MSRDFVSLPDRIKNKTVILRNGCWEWIGAIDVGGYGRCRPLPGGSSKAHRVVYELLVDEIPDGLDIDHLCRNRACVNPDHLEPVTRAENIRRGIRPAQLRAWHAKRTHCKNGHSLVDPDNVYRDPKRGVRHCRACRAAFNRTRRIRLVEAA